MSEVRQRKKVPEEAKSPAALAKAEDNPGISLLDIARSAVFLVLASCALSYFVTRESVVWGLGRPDWARPEVVKTWINGPKQYTDADLKAYSGTNPDLPILLAINGTIYDVSAGRKHYGPGGSYHFFAGADASRAFVTNCFDVDITPDMRGVEDMFLPLDNPEVDGLYTSGELKMLKQKERKEAREKVDKALRHWTEFFAGSKKYVRIGEVKREKGWETKGPKPTLCPKAQDGRVSRAKPEGR